MAGPRPGTGGPAVQRGELNERTGQCGTHHDGRLELSAQHPPGKVRRKHADVAQLVAHHLAKVRVAGSNPVVRSEGARVPHRTSVSAPNMFGGVAEWLRQGPAKPCTRVRFPPPPRAISSVGERFLDTEEVTGSIPVSPTTIRPGQVLKQGNRPGRWTSSGRARSGEGAAGQHQEATSTTGALSAADWTDSTPSLASALVAYRPLVAST